MSSMWSGLLVPLGSVKRVDHIEGSQKREVIKRAKRTPNPKTLQAAVLVYMADCYLNRGMPEVRCKDIWMSLGSNQEKVNQTLRRMKDQELVSVRREGYAAFYSLSDKAKPVSVVRSDGASTHGLLSLDNANLLHSA